MSTTSVMITPAMKSSWLITALKKNTSKKNKSAKNSHDLTESLNEYVFNYDVYSIKHEQTRDEHNIQKEPFQSSANKPSVSKSIDRLQQLTDIVLTYKPLQPSAINLNNTCDHSANSSEEDSNNQASQPDDLEEFFEKYGPLSYCRIVVNLKTQHSQGSAKFNLLNFVKFKFKKDAEKCLQSFEEDRIIFLVTLNIAPNMNECYFCDDVVDEGGLVIIKL
ncbi:hypothetical protein HELRODRAFT_182455 [Helobdella robusta]|uniref:RRM domain-containing protein n=1 Tax=Helobdella robusta TaxID=6412 RepID=T1FI80_HELRO|nr:hypothetical protein HELRODRAFT_182455 [Helobdella robusta]ESN90983.1 hypothetical protein HELRODRAFT_182455 [Helobdella robusta]